MVKKNFDAQHLVLFLTLGYPNWEEFYGLLDLIQQRGIGFVELGIPTNKPHADGEVIKKTHELMRPRLSHEKICKALEQIRERYSFQVILMTYAEGIDHFDLDKLDPQLYDAILCVDRELDVHDFRTSVHLFSSETSEEELKAKLPESEPFAYLVSSSGSTGGSFGVSTEYCSVLERMRRYSEQAIFVGFGISTADDLRSVYRTGADGAIIGSALLRHINKGGIEGAKYFLDSLELEKGEC